MCASPHLTFLGAKVEEAMKQLASNPLFAANPACLGELLERLVHGAAQKAVCPDMHVGTPASSPVTPHQGGAATEGGDEEVQAGYKSFWAKFKRQSVPTLDVEPLREQPPDNQLGDPTLYPPSPSVNGAEPSTPAAAAEDAASAGETSHGELCMPAAAAAATAVEPAPVVAKQAPSPTSEELETKATLTQGGGHGSQQVGDLEPFGGNFSPAFEKELDAMFGPTPAGEPPAKVEKKRQFSPTAADVSACLQRKTTVDLAGESMAGHTQVLMLLADVWQPVWVPLGKNQAVAAGLRLYEPDAAVAQVEQAILKGADALATLGAPNSTEPAPPTSKQQAANTAEQPPAPSQTAMTADQAQNTESAQKDTDPAKVALKNGYMRFHRSVTSALDALNQWSCLLARGNKSIMH